MTKLKNKYIVLAMETDAPYFTFACVRQDMSWGSERDAHQSDDKDWLEKASDMVRWFSMIGGCPKSLVESGNYLCFYPNDARDFLQTDKDMFVPDATIHVDDNIVYLYKLED